jgi:hypothetical protein
MLQLETVIAFIDELLVAGANKYPGGGGILDLRARVVTDEEDRQGAMCAAVAGAAPHLAEWLETATLVPVGMLACAMRAVDSPLLAEVRLLNLGDCPLQNSDARVVERVLAALPKCRVVVLRGSYLCRVAGLMKHLVRDAPLYSDTMCGLVDISERVIEGKKRALTVAGALIHESGVGHLVWANGLDDLAFAEWLKFVPPVWQRRAISTHQRYYATLKAVGLYNALYGDTDSRVRCVHVMEPIPEEV